jgi:hypothetical protein
MPIRKPFHFIGLDGTDIYVYHMRDFAKAVRRKPAAIYVWEKNDTISPEHVIFIRHKKVQFRVYTERTIDRCRRMFKLSKKLTPTRKANLKKLLKREFNRMVGARFIRELDQNFRPERVKWEADKLVNRKTHFDTKDMEVPPEEVEIEDDGRDDWSIK